MIDGDWNQLLNDCGSIHDVNYNSGNIEINEIIENDDYNENDEYDENDEDENIDFAEIASIDENSLRYFLGFCLKKLKNCIECQTYYLKQDKTELISS